MLAFSYVRWSSLQQTSGDSLRRQTTLAKEWATKHNVKLDNTSYQDHGISAFKGKNVVEGKLGTFLKAIDEGKIDTPCYLLVEALDRITRLELLSAMRLFISIIERGVTIVTLNDGQQYSAEVINAPGGEMLMFGAMYTLVVANQDSSRRAKRVKEAWDNKKKLRHQGVIASKGGPAWLKLSEDRKKWIVIKEKAAVVKRIYALALAGNGTHVITKILNDEKVPIVGTRRRRDDNGNLVERRQVWEQSHVASFFRSEAVYGRWVSADKKQQKDGYYPVIVSKDDWDAVQASRKNRKGKGGFKQGTTNLFSHLARCAYCGKGLKLRNYGERYLQCRNSLHNGCGATRISYGPLESDILSYLINWMHRDLSPQKMEQTTKSQRRDLEQQIHAKQEELEQLMKIASLTKTDVVVLADKLSDAQLELDRLQAELAALSRQSLSMKDVEDAVELMYKLTVEPTVELRKEVQVQLRRQIRFIDVAPNLQDHPKHLAKFEIKKKPTSPLHMVRITYVDGSVGLTDIVTA